MSHRLWPRVLALALMLAVALVAGTAVAASKKAPKKATVTAKSSFKIKPNKFFQDNARFRPGNIVIASGGTLTLRNADKGEPHTFSIVAKGDVPKGTNKILNCGSPGTICDKIFSGHQPDQQGNPTVPVVNVGAPGVDQAGDSFILNPRSSQKVNVTAKKGTTLYFMCGIHGWMQGKIRVR